MPRLSAAVCLVVLACWPTIAASNPDAADTRMLTQPAISASHIAFVYAADLWLCDLDGHNARRLSSGEGLESMPAFSPDGTLVAFSAQYDGNTDVYVVPVAGGVPTRLAWHPGDDVVQGFSPDGATMLFTSPREVFTSRHTQLYSVPITGGMPERLPVPHAARAHGRPMAPRWMHRRPGWRSCSCAGPKCCLPQIRWHSAADASRPAALLVGRILPVFSLLAPCGAGASAPSVRHRIHGRQH